MSSRFSKKQMQKMMYKENLKKEIRNSNKIFSEGFIFDISKMRKDVKQLFNEFLKEHPEIANKDRLKPFVDYDNYDPSKDWVVDYIENWNKDENKVFIFIKNEELTKWKNDRNNKWFCQQLIRDFSTFFNSGLNLKKTFRGEINPYYRNTNVFSLFSVFCFYLYETNKC
jgi:hypothetical protein